MEIVNPNYAFLKKDYANPNLCAKPTEKKLDVIEKSKSRLPKWTSAFASSLVLTTPMTAFAASDSFVRIYQAVMNAADWGVVLVLIFAGANWMLGHRSKAMEHVLCAACGYLLIRHAMDIRDFLKSI